MDFEAQVSNATPYHAAENAADKIGQIQAEWFELMSQADALLIKGIKMYDTTPLVGIFTDDPRNWKVVS